MSELHIRQIKAALDKTFRSLIEVSDLAQRPAADQENGFLTRALAALALAHLASISPEDAAASVVDGFHDNGIDAAYYHPSERVLYLAQSKWKHDGSGSIERGDLQKFLKGFKDLINARWDRFAEKLSKKKTLLESALNDTTTRIVLVVVYTGQAPLSEEVKRDLKDAMDEVNSPIEIVSSQPLRQADIYSVISQGLSGAPIDIEVALYDWGQVREPYQGFYGQVAASDVAQWIGAHQNRLFAPNLRVFLGLTNVNINMVETLTTDPEKFWYFNNGLTALCRKIAKKPIGGNARETGIFECTDLRIVNGAQTVGAIADAAQKDPEKVGRARVWIRLVSLESCPPGLDKEITKYNNSQNRIEHRDFVALDPNQERIASELALEGVSYVYKSGETLLDQVAGFDIVEATVARACLQSDVTYTVQAKAEIGRLWEDIEKAPYRVLFNTSVAGPSIWRLVQILRGVERLLAKRKRDADGRKRLLAVHGNRFIVYAVMQQLAGVVVNSPGVLAAADVATIEDLTSRVFDNVLSIVDDDYPDAYLANLFKNIDKCRKVAGKVLKP